MKIFTKYIYEKNSPKFGDLQIYDIDIFMDDEIDKYFSSKLKNISKNINIKVDVYESYIDILTLLKTVSKSSWNHAIALYSIIKKIEVDVDEEHILVMLRPYLVPGVEVEYKKRPNDKSIIFKFGDKILIRYKFKNK